MLHLLGKQEALTSALSPLIYQASVLAWTLKFQGLLKPDQQRASIAAVMLQLALVSTQ